MPSLRTRQAYDRRVLETAEEALASAAASVSAVTGQLEDLADGELALDAVTIGGVRFINNGGVLEAQL